MKVFYITFRSVTYAQRGERILTRERIRCSLQRTPRWMESQGCGYALRVWEKEVETAVRLLQQNQVALRRVYVQRAGGELEEMPV